MNSFKVIVKRDLGNLITNPMLMFYNAVFPFLLIGILGYLSNGGYGQGGANAFDYYGVTMLLYSVINVTLTASNTFMERGLKNSNLRVLHAPVSTSAVYLSKIVSTFLFTSVCFVIQMALSALLLGVNYGGANAVFLLLLILVFDFFACSLGVMCCCLFKSEEAANKILSLITTVLAIFGGLFFQLDALGDVGAVISAVSPVKWVLDASVRIIWDGNLGPMLPACGILIALSAACLLGCKRFFRTEDYV